MKISLTGLSSLGLAAIAISVNAQITPDSSLSTQVQQKGDIAEITGGKQAGGNLFHSFQDFSLPTNNTAFFNNGLDIDNILSRVTGGNISAIDGLIQSNGDANLFLINPAGIVFGDNARLDVGGSFLGSTATGLLFDDGTEFNATNTIAPLLTINAPIGLNLREGIGNISSRGNLSSSGDLTLSANNLDLQGELIAVDNLTLTALDTMTVRDSINNAFIARAGDRLSFQGSNIDLFILNNSQSGLFSGGDLTLRSDRPINGDAHYYSGGNFRIERLDHNLGSLISQQDPIVRSRGDVSFASYSGASLHILAGGNVTIDGSVEITGTDTTVNALKETLTLSNGSSININGNAQPTLDIRGGIDNVDPPGVMGSGINPDLTNAATGSNITIAGEINNPGGRVFLTNQYQPNTALTEGDITATAINTSNTLGNGGDVTIDSRRDINIANSINTSAIADRQLVTTATLEPVAETEIRSGKGGAIALLAIEDITTGNFNTSSGVNLNLITEVDTIDEANVDFRFPNANIGVAGGGDINLQGNNIKVENLNSSSTVTIDSDSIALDNFSIIGAVLELDIADGGNINLNAKNNLTAQNINSNLFLSDRFASNSQTTPNITLAVSELALTIPQANLGSGGDILLQAGNTINTRSLNSSVAVINNANNTATILANDPSVATTERPSRAFSSIDIFYDNIELDRGGTIQIKSDRANLGNIDSSIKITSESIVFAEATADNDAAANSFANSNISLNAIADRPGEIFFEVNNGINFDDINAGAEVNAVNNLDSVAMSNSDNAIANADNTSSNIIIFDSQINFALIRFDLNTPDVNLGISHLPRITNSAIKPPVFNTCPVNADKLTPHPQAIKTAIGKIYPARGVAIQDGQIHLTAKPTKNSVSRTSRRIESCI
ncbi:filamentous hemagglutinin N-terminal domain-containing protein [Waterburya agarophytonicola K14]|uniref:Filamentous hemagglutinin N-terminal domain-containing protein n=1 Tax=Waterburya agarophytonicola KI4 TaxID=2874699 RepID=A0A964BLW8_9CYAN|nr:filamentous hemagglutinin N-terminal domain-containing protein [Waterburya agarophytonicola]MCC0175464.1 filamentous hemagglutinin N-terminal domain-containing protein [Waterburya agarophytonicola KI4]